MGTKICARCKQELSIENFYIDKHGKFNSYCKKCDKERKTEVYEPPKNLNFYKICSCCGQEKLASEFNKHKRRKDGLSTQCKKCDSVKQKQYKEKYKNNIIPKTKICSKCGKEKPASEFSMYSRSFDRLSAYCKQCAKEFTDKRIDYIKKHKIEITEDYTKVCNICKQAKPASEFYKSSYNIDGLQYTCKECEKREERRIYNLNYARQIIEKECKLCGAKYFAARNASDRCINCRNHTIPETIFIDILKKYNIEYDTECRVNKLNIWCDFYLPKYNIFIDVSPTPTHNTIGKIGVFDAKPKDYHIKRRITINEEGYNYINIWDWDKPENIVKAILDNSLIIKKQNKPNVFWCKNNLQAYSWGNYSNNVYKIYDKQDNEQQMIAEGWVPVYDDGQTLIY